MPSPPVAELSLLRAVELDRPAASRPGGKLDYTAIRGRLVEVSGAASLAFLCSLILEAQSLAEPAVWISSGDTVFYPPDAAANGVDLSSLAVVRATDIREAARAAHHLLHSGAFGIVALDAQDRLLPQGILGRFARLAEKNGTAFVCLTAHTEPEGRGLGSMVSLRVRTRIERLSPGLFRCSLDVVKDKRQGAGLHAAEVYRAPPGLR